MKNSRFLRFFGTLLLVGSVAVSPVWVPSLLANNTDKQKRSPHKSPTPKPTPTPKRTPKPKG
ncbi:MAG: hypothetical protein ACR2FX_06560 [Chthoniobacterales bacterium]